MKDWLEVTIEQEVGAAGEDKGSVVLRGSYDALDRLSEMIDDALCEDDCMVDTFEEKEGFKFNVTVIVEEEEDV